MVDEYTRHLERNKEVKGKGLSQFRMKVLATGNAWLYGLRLLVLALVCEVPYDYVVFGSAFDMHSQNPVIGLVVALIVRGILDLMYAWRTSVLKEVLTAGVIIIGLLWDFMLSIGQTQRLMNVGIVTLGMCVTYYYLTPCSASWSR